MAIDPVCKMDVDEGGPPGGHDRARGPDLLLLRSRMQAGLREEPREVPRQLGPLALGAGGCDFRLKRASLCLKMVAAPETSAR